MSVRARLGRFFDGSMRANAVALVTHQLASAALGFIYWVLAARLYSVENVGAASATISTLQLVSGIAQLGLVSGMQRFIPRAGRHARRLASAAYAAASASAALAGLGALWLTDTLAPQQRLLGSISPGWVVVAAVAWTLFYLQDGVLVGLRQAVWVLAENFAYNLSKIVLLVLGARFLVSGGIVVSWFLPVPVAVLLVTWLVFGLLLRPERLTDHHDPAEQVGAREVVRSISGDHIGALANEAGIRLLPLLVVRLAGVAQNAYFYQAWTMSAVLALVAGAMANSFMAETASDRSRVGENSRAILRTMARVLLPAGALVALAAPLVLHVFGPEYARQASLLLRLFALAVAPVAVNAWYIAYLRVMGHIRRLIGVQVLSAIGVVTLAWLAVPRFGITGVGAAYLAVQTSVALFALLDTRTVLRGAQAPAEGLRRADWRFLLPVPHPRTVAVSADGPLARSARLLDAEVVDIADASACDLVVVDAPDAERLREAAAALGPGGTCYAEWRFPRTLRGIAARLRTGGFEDVELYWPAPRLGSARLWLRVPSPDATYRRTVRRLLRDALPPGAPGAAVALAADLAMRVDLLPDVVSLARLPGGAANSARPFGRWLEATLQEATGDGTGLVALMRTGGTYDESKVNWLVYGRDDGRLRLVAKTARAADSLAYLEREYRMLEHLAEREWEPPFAVPQPVLRTGVPGFALYAQTAVPGTPLGEAAQAAGYATLAERISRALASLASDVAPASRAEWWDGLVEPWLTRLEEQVAGTAGAAIVRDARQALLGLGELPLVLAHNDCTPWNMTVSRDGLGLFDWETADEAGLPATDLVYCLATLAFLLDGTEGTPGALASYRRLLDPDDERGAAFETALRHYADAAGIAADDLSRLRVATWLAHATHDLHNRAAEVAERRAEAIATCVCLPILRAELDRNARRAAATAAEIAPTRPAAEALFISPHLDDAVLSCGAAIRHLIASGTRVTVATVFTEDLPPGELPSPLAAACHAVWAAGDRPFSARRAEDIAALATLGAQPLHLGFLDAVYRRSSKGAVLYPENQHCCIDDGDGCLSDLTGRLRELLGEHPDALVFGPAGVGGHVDHLLVRRALEDAAPARLVYYEEYPYVAWSANVRGSETQHAASYRFRPAPNELVAHRSAVDYYTTQLPGLFPSLAGRVCRALRERLPHLCAWLPMSDGPDQARERMAKRLARDAERYGETYHWSDRDWSGPFEADVERSYTLM